MTAIENILKTLCPLVADLNYADPNWVVYGSAALALNGVELTVNDIDIMLSLRGAMELEQNWQHMRRRDVEIIPIKDELFRSRLSMYHTPCLDVELSGQLEIRKQESWIEVRPTQILTTPQGIRHCSLPACMQMLVQFGRRKDLDRLQLIHRQMDAATGL